MTVVSPEPEEQLPGNAEEKAPASAPPTPASKPPHPSQCQRGNLQTRCIGGLGRAPSNMTLSIHPTQSNIILDQKGDVICKYGVLSGPGGSGGETIKNVYILSPFCHRGPDSPVACIARFQGQAMKECAGDLMKIYTFEPSYVGQPEAKSKGLSGEPMYSFSRFKQSCCGGSYSYLRYEQNILSKDPCMVGQKSGIPATLWASAFLCLIPYCLAKFRLELYNPDHPGTNLVTLDEKNKTIEVAAGGDVLEAVCIWCAFEVVTSLS